MRQNDEKGRSKKIKLGQFLLKEKLVTQEQLDEALKSQAIFGGRLGSYLVEAGVLREDQLASLLSRKYQVPFARSSHFANLSPELIKCVPRELAEKYLVLPLRKEGRRLDLAMPDPGDLRMIEEISFRTGCIIRPVVAPETVIVTHLRRYYGVSQIGTFIPVIPQEVPEIEPPPSTEKELLAWLGGPEQDAILKDWERQLYSESTPESTAGKAGVLPFTKTSSPRPAITPVDSLDELGHRLAENLERDQMADIVAAYLSERYTAAALFLVRKNMAIGWRGLSGGETIAGFENLQIDLASPSVLQTVAHTKSVYVGPLLDQPGNRRLIQALDAHEPEQILVAPVLLSDRLIGLIYVDDRKHLVLSDLMRDLRKLTAILAIGLEVLILKNKLRAM